MDTVKTTGAAPASAGTAPARHRIPARTRLDFWFDGALLAAYTHDTTAKLTLALVPVHVALRWRWILSVGRRVLHRDPGRSSR
jgi:hypothetical protein